MNDRKITVEFTCDDGVYHRLLEELTKGNVVKLGTYQVYAKEKHSGSHLERLEITIDATIYRETKA